MNKKTYIVLTLILSLFNINKTYAACTQEEIDEFKKIEDEYKVTYEFNETTKNYTVTFNSPKTGIYDYRIHTEKDIICKDLDEEGMKTECYNIEPNEYTIDIIGKTNTCDDVLKTFTIKLPEYNKFYEDPLCEGIEEFYLCQPTYDKEIDYDTFVSRVNTYKKSKQNSSVEPTEEENDAIDDLKIYVKENIVQIIIIIIFLILLITTVIITANSIRKSRRLE